MSDDLVYDHIMRVNRLEAQNARLEADKRELLKFVKAAKEWFDHFGADAPIVFGGEAEMSEDARALLIKNGISTKPETGSAEWFANIKEEPI